MSAAAPLKDIDESHHVAFNVGMRVFKAVSHTRLSGQVNDPVKDVIGKKGLHLFPVRQITADKAEGFVRAEPGETGFFQSYIVVVIQVVNPDNRVSVIEETFTQVKPDETGNAGNKNRVLICGALCLNVTVPVDNESSCDTAPLSELHQWIYP